MMHQMTKTIFQQRIVVPALQKIQTSSKKQMIIEQEEKYDFDESVEDEPVP